MNQPCISLDLETTGLNPETDEIIEIGAVRFQGEQVVDTFQSLVNPQRPLPYRIQVLCGIAQSDVDAAPMFSDIASSLTAFLGTDPIVGHNVSFDINFLAGKGIKRAKEGNTLGRITLTLFYATDFADRLENEIVPALRAGFVVLTDRYIYSLMARALVRGLDPAWIRNLYSFALKPDAVFYLRIGVEDLIPRVVFSHGFDYWESGMDLHASEDMYESFCKYQSAIMTQLDGLTQEYGFEVVDASERVEAVFRQLRSGIRRVLKEEPRTATPAAPRRKPPEGAEEEPGVAELPAPVPQVLSGGKAGE